MTPQEWIRILRGLGGASAGQPGSDDQDDGSATPLLAGEGSAQGRDQYVNGQVQKLRGIAEAQPPTAFKGDVHRAVGTANADTYNNHSFSQGGRYNRMGEPALYTSPTVADVQAEAKNYGSAADPTGLDGKTVVRSEFEGNLLDARTLPDVSPDALKEPYGLEGKKRSLLTRVTGEDPYTMPRTVSDVAQQRNLSGVIAPANDGTTNIPLFPEKAPASGDGALHDNLAYKGSREVSGGVIQPEVVSATVKPNIPDATPNRNMTAAKIAADEAAHGRASGARYGAAGAAAVSLGKDAVEGHFGADDAKELAVNTAEGAVIGKVDSTLAGGIAKGLAGGGAAEAEIAGLRGAAGAASAGIIGAVVGGGVAAWHDADKVEAGTMKAGDATADVAVSAGVGLGSGLAGAAAGAAIGSIVPVAGTAVGAVVGFGVGMVASVGATMLAEGSGLADKARKALGGFLDDHFEKPLESLWHGASEASHAVGDAAKAVVGAVTGGGGAAAPAAQGAPGAAAVAAPAPVPAPVAAPVPAPAAAAPAAAPVPTPAAAPAPAAGAAAHPAGPATKPP